MACVVGVGVVAAVVAVELSGIGAQLRLVSVGVAGGRRKKLGTWDGGSTSVDNLSLQGLAASNAATPAVLGHHMDQPRASPPEPPLSMEHQIQVYLTL